MQIMATYGELHYSLRNYKLTLHGLITIIVNLDYSVYSLCPGIEARDEKGLKLEPEENE